MSSANKRQVGGGHYRNESGNKSQHWDLVTEYHWDYFQAQIIKYVMRHKRKNGVEDLKKAAHFLEKYIEIRVQDEKDCGDPNRHGRPLSERVADCTQGFGDGKEEGPPVILGDATKKYVDQ